MSRLETRALLAWATDRSAAEVPSVPCEWFGGNPQPIVEVGQHQVVRVEQRHALWWR